MIWYSIHQSELSTNTMVASTKHGICATLLDCSEFEAPTKLARIFPKEKFQFESVRNFNYAWTFLDALDNLLNPSPNTNGINMDKICIDIISGTPLQQKIWLALRKIPLGTTISYSNLAEQLGMCRAARPVATACAQNPISIILPCHRVVPKSGGIGQYRWGTKIKQRLLEQEKC